MPDLREQHLVGLDYLTAVTTLLQRIRKVHPTAGSWEAADRQWSWRNVRSTNHLAQLFWFDHFGRPQAAVITTEPPHGVAFDPTGPADGPAAAVALTD